MDIIQRLVGACSAGAIFLGGATAVYAQEKLVFQSVLPTSTLMFENVSYWAEQVNKMSGGRLEIEVLPAGTIVPAFETLDAVSRGVLDGGHTAAAFWVGKNPAAALFGAAPGGPFGMDFIDYLGWIYDAGGLELYRELYQDVLSLNVVPFPLTVVAQQPLGWFKDPVEGWTDLQGRKCRQTGLAAELFSRAGMSPVNMPPGEIVPAGERGVIECAELVGPAEDMKVGFHLVWKNLYAPSMHEPGGVLEVLFNGDVWNGLSPDLQAIVQTAAVEAGLMSHVKYNRLNSEALDELRQSHGVEVRRTPEEILVKTLETWDEIAVQKELEDPFFKKVYEAQRGYAAKVVPTRRDLNAPYEFGANHYWPEPE